MASDFCFGALLCQKYELFIAGSSFNTVVVFSCVSHLCLVRRPEVTTSVAGDFIFEGVGGFGLVWVGGVCMVRHCESLFSVFVDSSCCEVGCFTM